MSAPKPAAPPGPKVSPARTVVSLVMLLVVGGICLIELRAGLGQVLTGKAFAAISEEGAFKERITEDEARAMVKMFPSESVQSDSETAKVLKFEWYSLLRPLMGEGNPQIFLEVTKQDPAIAKSFHTSAEEENDKFADVVPGGPDDMGSGGPPMGGMMGGGPPGGPGGGMGPSGMGPGGPGGPGREFGPGGPGGPGGLGGPGGGRGGRGQRPPLEGEENKATETPATEPPATETPATETPATETPATETPATEPPATEPPATEPPATEPPATEPPATEPPATEPPATEPPATEPPATEPPANPGSGQS